MEVAAAKLSGIHRAVRAAGLQSKLLLRAIYLPEIIDAMNTLHAPDRVLTPVATDRGPHHRDRKCDPGYDYK